MEDRESKDALKWIVALICPFFLAILFVATDTAFDYADFVDDLPNGIGFWILFGGMLMPSYIILFFVRSRFTALLVYFFVSIIYVPMLWLLILFTACYWFRQCF